MQLQLTSALVATCLLLDFASAVRPSLRTRSVTPAAGDRAVKKSASVYRRSRPPRVHLTSHDDDDDDEEDDESGPLVKIDPKDDDDAPDSGPWEYIDLDGPWEELSLDDGDDDSLENGPKDEDDFGKLEGEKFPEGKEETKDDEDDEDDDDEPTPKKTRSGRLDDPYHRPGKDASRHKPPARSGRLDDLYHRPGKDASRHKPTTHSRSGKPTPHRPGKPFPRSRKPTHGSGKPVHHSDRDSYVEIY